ncbi:MAG TPA: NADH-quinone oxidoreductase subunit C, partial [Anaeromyxobacteraceae bacterium]|nr:NADH-quinone oxidoreductase subunit C [Anaeromyxobacteraceae bacterium]
MSARVLQAWNAEAFEVGDVPLLPVDEFQQIVADAVTAGARVSSLAGRADGDRTRVTAVLADDADGRLGVLACRVGPSWPSLAAECPQLQAFERELLEQFGVRPEGHPWLKPLRFEPPLAKGVDPWGRLAHPTVIPGDYPFFRVEGEEVHEVAVGPVHAGVIEPGHFRFQCHGEHVFTLEIVLGWQHRGVEPLLVAGPDRRTVTLLESVAGDTAVGNAIAHANAVEALADVQIPARGSVLRAVALELERLTNHVGDL